MKSVGNHPKKVLVIARDFIPYIENLGGALRAIKMAEYFIENGIEVFVLAAKGVELGYYGYEDILKKVKVLYVSVAWQFDRNAVYRRHDSNGVERPLPYQIAKKLNRDMRKEVFVPDLGILFVNRYVNQAISLIKQYDIKNVIVSSPPHSTQVIGLKLKQRMGDQIRLIVDYRDSWNNIGIFRKKNWILRKLSERLEKKVLAAADKFTYQSPPVLKKINERFMNITDKSLLVMNGFDRRMKRGAGSVSKKDGPLKIGYFVISATIGPAFEVRNVFMG